MKKLKLSGKLSLNKETVSRLSDNQMNDAKGGNTPGFLSIGQYCTTSSLAGKHRCLSEDITNSLWCAPTN